MLNIELKSPKKGPEIPKRLYGSSFFVTYFADMSWTDGNCSRHGGHVLHPRNLLQRHHGLVGIHLLHLLQRHQVLICF